MIDLTLLKSVCPVELNEKQLEQFETYAKVLVEYNEKVNLTAITDPEGIVIKHFSDCAYIIDKFCIPKNASVIDVGTGAGFPGVVLKILRPDIRLTLLDSLNKRIVFLEYLLERLGIVAETVHARAEDGAKGELREKFDFSVSRGVAALPVLSELCIPYVKIGGAFLAQKGPSGKQEAAEAEGAIKAVGGEIGEIKEFALSDNSERTIIEVKKIKPSAKHFPRAAAIIKKKPL